MPWKKGVVCNLRAALAWLVGVPLVIVAGAAPALTARIVALEPSPTATPSGGHSVSGHVAVTLECTGDYAGVVVALLPPGRTTVTADDGTFTFAAVPDGRYSVLVEPGCSPSNYCFDPLPVEVHGSDVELEVCFNPSPCDPENLRVEPLRVRPGGSLDVSGRCYYVHSGAGVTVYFDAGVAAQLNGDTSGGYHATFTVPVDAALGSHTVRVVATGSGMEIAHADVEVVESLPGCLGDCNADGTVTIDELIAGVTLALGGDGRPACAPAFCSVDCGPGPARRLPTVDCLVRAVRNAATGCPAGPCASDGDCDDGNSFSQGVCTPAGCEHTCLAVSPR